MTRDRHGAGDAGNGTGGVGRAPTVLGRTRGPDADRDGAAVAALHADVVVPARERFAPVRHIARGGMSTVDEVSDRVLGRRTAKKTLREEHGDDIERARFFVREAQITSQLDHPGIVPVHTLGLDGAGRLFFTLKLVRGRTLRAIVRDLPRAPIDYEQLLNLLDVVVKVCDALRLAHSRGVVHRDVKPENVLVGDFGETYLVDWGIAHVVPGAAEAGAPAIEATPVPFDRAPGEPAHDTFIGTPAYMAPEQASGDLDALGPHTDVFGVGALLYEILTRRAPYAGRTAQAAIAQALECRLLPPEEVVPPDWVPLGLRRIVARAMARLPGDRYPDVGALRADLIAFSRGGGAFPTMRFAAGEAIVHEGEQGDCAYIIRVGRCAVYRAIAGVRTLVDTLGPGDVFGETAVLSPGARIASVVALDDVSVHVVTGEVLTHQVDSMHPWMGLVVRTLAVRFRQVSAREPVLAPGAAPASLPRLAFMALCAFGAPDGEGRPAMAWSRLCAEVGVGAAALGEALAGCPEIELAPDADRAVLVDRDAMRERLEAGAAGG